MSTSTARRLPPPGGAGSASGADRTLVGRGQDLARFLGTVVNPPAVVLIEGETGIGKTTLVREVLADPALLGTTRLLGHCRPLHEPLPLGPIIEALGALAGRLDGVRLSPVTAALRPLLPELAGELPAPLDGLSNSSDARLRLFRAVRAVLEAVTPVVIVVEDLHWADASTAEFLRYLAGNLSDGVAVVVTFRPEDLDDHGLGWLTRQPPHVEVTRLPLAPLTPDQVGALVRSMLDTSTVPAEFSAFLHQRTAGLPFAVEELVRLLQDRDQLMQRNGRLLRDSLGDLDVPDAVRATIRARLSALPDDARLVAQALAVLAAPAARGQVAQVSGMAEEGAMAGLVALDRARLLTETSPGVHELRHDLARQVVMEDISVPRRRWLHLRAARALEGEASPPLGALARHYREAGAVDDWVRCAEAAAEAAMSQGNAAAAVALLEDLVAEPITDDATRVRLASQYANAAVESRLHGHGISVVRTVLRETSQPPSALTELRYCLARLLFQDGQILKGRAVVEDMAQLVEEDPLAASRAMNYLGVPWVPGVLVDEHLGWLDRGVEVDIAAGFTNRLLQDRADRNWIQVMVGLPAPRDESAQIFDDLTQSPVQQLRFAYNLAYIFLAVGDHSEAARWLAVAAQLIAELDNHRMDPPAAGLRLWLDWMSGRWRGLGERASSLQEAAPDSPTVVTAARLVTGALTASQGHLDDALRCLQAVGRDGLDTGEMPLGVAATAEHARVLMAAGRPEAAVAAAEQAVDLSRGKNLWTWAGELIAPAVRALLLTESYTAAAALVEECATGVEGRVAPAVQAGLAQARAVLAEADGDLDTAITGYRRSAALWGALPRPQLAVLARTEFGRAAASLDRDDGVTVLQDAVERLSDMGARWDANIVAAQLRALGVRSTHRRGRKGYGTALSPREREVAELAAAGRSNPEIAEALVLSRNTVQNHMSSVLRKLSVASREEIVLPDTRESSQAN